MAQQKKGGKSNFKSFASATGGKKKKKGEGKGKGVAKATKRARRGDEKKKTQSILPFASGYCASRCGQCISCKIARGDEENRRRIAESQRLSESFSFGWGRRF